MRRSKRAFDLTCSLLGLLVCAPLFMGVWLLIRLEGRGPTFYKQERVGRRGEPFRLWKFRTMAVDADRTGKLLTVGSDPRVTKVGAWLRRTKVDELPQLINVLKGEMSLVGPRPEVAKYVDLYTPDQRRVLGLVPGITDPASLKYRHESELLATTDDPEREYIRVIMPDKLRLNLDYAANATLFSDLRLIGRTVLRMLE